MGEALELLFGPRIGMVASAGDGDARFGSRTSVDFALLTVNAGLIFITPLAMHCH